MAKRKDTTYESERELLRLLDETMLYWEPLHKQIRDNRNLRFGNYPINIPEAYKVTTREVRTPIIKDLLFRVVGSFLAEPPRISCPPLNETDKEKRKANAREKALVAAWKRMTREVGYDVSVKLVDGALADGMSVALTLERNEVYSNMRGYPSRIEGQNAKAYLDEVEDYKKRAELPFVVMYVDPLTYYPVYSGSRKTSEWYVYNVPLLDAMDEFGITEKEGRYVKIKPNNRREPVENELFLENKTVQVAECWTRNKVYYLIDRCFVEERENKRKRSPFTVFGGLITSSMEPAKAYQSIIEPFKHLIPAVEELLAMKMNWSAIGAFPFFLDKNSEPSMGTLPTGLQEAENITDIRPGSVLRGDVGFLSPPPVGQDLTDLVNLMLSFISKSGLASVMYGEMPAGSAGYLANQLATNSTLIYRPILKNFEMAMSEIMSNILRIVDDLGEEVPVYFDGKIKRRNVAEWMILDPKDINGFYEVDVKMKMVSQYDRIMGGDFGGRMNSAGILPKDFVIEELMQYDDPNTLLDQVAVERYLDSPQIAEVISLDAAEKAGLVQPPQQSPPTSNMGMGMAMGAEPSMPMGGIPSTVGGGQPYIPSMPGGPRM